jgi:hypothetical protein
MNSLLIAITLGSALKIRQSSKTINKRTSWVTVGWSFRNGEAQKPSSEKTVVIGIGVQSR